MGVQNIRTSSDPEQERLFRRRVLSDLGALERMIVEGLIESDRTRIGAEQELVLVDADLRPAPVGIEVLERIDDERVTTEIARFNLEFKCDPFDFRGDCLSRLRAQVEELLETVRRAAEQVGAQPMLTGICPTLELSHLSRENISPRPRYYALDDSLRAHRGGDYELRVKGADELRLRHPSVMLEALNTSFQVHYQVSAEGFADAYNVAQAVAAPVLAASVNSPILFAKRLWRETRIAIFQQVVDSRAEAPHTRDLLARVRFGEKWVERSALELFRDDVARFRPLLGCDEQEDPHAEIDAGRAPRLRALQAFASTIYRWNRACYGVTDGRPHLRIENRLFPAGPTVGDELANAAFWLGLMQEGPRAWQGLTQRLDFDDARANFTAAARQGLACHLMWLDGAELPATELILDILLPVARRGLERAGVDAPDIDAALDVIEARVGSRQTGAAWTLRSVAAMKGRATRAERLHRLARAMIDGQRSGEPVHTWAPAALDSERDWRKDFASVGQYMSTDLYTVSEDESIDLAASIMDWEHIRHIPVEDAQHRLVGIVSYRTLLRMLAQRRGPAGDAPVPVSEVMVRDPVTVTPETPTLRAIELMRDHGVSCLPVVQEGQLVGVISERDFVGVARRLLERSLREEEDETA